MNRDRESLQSTVATLGASDQEGADLFSIWAMELAEAITSDSATEEQLRSLCEAVTQRFESTKWWDFTLHYAVGTEEAGQLLWTFRDGDISDPSSSNPLTHDEWIETCRSVDDSRAQQALAEAVFLDSDEF